MGCSEWCEDFVINWLLRVKEVPNLIPRLYLGFWCLKNIDAIVSNKAISIVKVTNVFWGYVELKV